MSKTPKKEDPAAGSESPKGAVSQDPEMKGFNDALRQILSVPKGEIDRREKEFSDDLGERPKKSPRRV